MNSFDQFKKNKNEIANLIQLPSPNKTGPCGYVITDVNIEKFYEIYAKEIIKEIKKPTKKRTFHLVEKPTKEFGPLYIDFDFEWKEKRIDRVPELTIDLVKKCANFIQKFILDNFTSNNNNLYDYYILMRDNGYQKTNTIWKDGAHIQFPYIIMSYSDQLWIRDKVRQQLTDIFDILKTSNNYVKIYDKSISSGKTGWMLFGSIKPNCNQYNIVYPENVKLDDKPMLEWIKLFGIFNKNEINVNRKKILINIKAQDITNQLELPTLNFNNDNDNDNEVDENNNDNEVDENINYTINDVKKLVNMLSTTKEWEDWNKVGLCLHNLNLPKNDLFQIFDNYSKDNKLKYNKVNTLKTWKNYKKKQSGLKFGSLVKWALEEKNTKATKWLKNYNDRKNKKKECYDILSNHIMSNMKFNNELPQLKNLNMSHIIDYKEMENCIKTFLQKEGLLFNENIDKSLIVFTENGANLECVLDDLSVKRYPESGPLTIPENVKNAINIIINIQNNINIENNYYYGTNDINIYSFKNDFNKIKIFNDIENNKLLFESIDDDEEAIVKLITNECGNLFKSTRSSNKYIWFYFKNHRWQKDYEPKNIFNYIDKKYKNYITSLIDIYKFRNFENKEKKWKISKLEKLSKYCLKEVFKTNILPRLRRHYEDLNICEKFNTNKYLIGFNNGIFDLNSMIFRDGIPDDLITLTVGYDYTSIKTEKYNNIIKFFEDIQPDHNDREYLLKFLSSCLNGENRDRLFHIFSGKTTNGKSALGYLLSLTLGTDGYVGEISESFISENRSSSEQCSPALLSLKDKRSLIINEPSARKKINTAFIKSLTGGRDMISGRNLFKDDLTKYIPGFKIILLCNDKPIMDNNDDAIWERSRCLNFPITFVDNPTKENEKKINRNLYKEMEYWKQDFMILLLEYYKKYIEEGLKPTENILRFTKKHNLESDVYKRFVNETVIYDISKRITYKKLRDTFENWYRIEINSNYVPTRNKIRKEFEKIFTIQNSLRIDNINTVGIKGIYLK
jgi:phage/plasmid-associated DNA primase